MDQSKKTMRHFYCRDVLWETFEQMANDFDCSIDYLINEAMRYYARSKNYHSAQPTGGDLRSLPSLAGNISGAAAASIRRGPPPPPGPGTKGQAGGAATHSGQVTLSADSKGQDLPGARAQGSPASPRPTPDSASPAVVPTLFLLFNEQRISIDKDQFIIGRGSKSSDLPIKDGNISRKHAAIIRRNGTYYIKDLGSTNGIDYKGMRIDNKRIDEGDVFHLCDYELRFTYRA